MSLIPEEISDSDKTKLSDNYEEIIETVEIGPYTAILIKNRKNGVYQIGLTSHERTFTTVMSQNKKQTKEDMKTIISLWSTLTDKIKEWLQKYGNILGGSMNTEKTEKYHKIFKRYGLKCGDIFSLNGGSGFFIYRN
jgi:hypothetical protein